jgi:hypothetical protein
MAGPGPTDYQPSSLLLIVTLVHDPRAPLPVQARCSRSTSPSRRPAVQTGGRCWPEAGRHRLMTDEEHLENAVPDPGGEDESFDVHLPVTPTMDEAGATHVAHMRGSEAGFRDVLAGFVATGSDLSQPLRSPVGDVEQVRLALEGLGPARVESIDKL